MALRNGEEALDFVCYRGKGGDRVRVLRQMDFMRALARRGTSPAVFWRWPGFLEAAVRSLRSNIEMGEWPFLFLEAKHFRAPDVNPWFLPGRFRGADWEMDEERAAFVLARLIADGEPSMEAPGELPPGSEPPAAGRSATVKVWNASGRAGLALAVARRLRALGFDVVEWGNFPGRQGKTRVMDRSGNVDRARRLAEHMGLPAPYSDADPALRTDVEVILGEDFELSGDSPERGK